MSNVKEFAERLGMERATYYGSSNPAPPPHPYSAQFVDAVLSEARMWAHSNDTYYGAPETAARLPPGVYRTGMSERMGPMLTRVAIAADSLVMLPDEASRIVIDEFATFWARRDEFVKRGLVQKRGYMLWGPPGSGKTATLTLLSRALVEDMGGLVILLDIPSIATACLSLVRRLEPERPIVCIMEDLDALVQRYGESEWLALLDGESQIDRVAFLATTNYPERLDKRFVDRPSRFDTLRFVGMPSASARRAYLAAKEPSLQGALLDRWVALSAGFSIAHLKEMVVAVFCLGQQVADVAERLAELHGRQPSSEDQPGRKSAGFDLVAAE